MRYAMVENVLIFVTHSLLATTVGIGVSCSPANSPSRPQVD
jgi:hypothetical protein